MPEKLEGLEQFPQSKLTPGWMGLTQFINRNEPCWSIEELNAGEHRWQVVVVNRKDVLTACYFDLGSLPKDKFPPEFAWLCGFDYSVAEALDWALEHREDLYWEMKAAEEAASHNLITDFITQQEQLADHVKKNLRNYRAKRQTLSTI